MLTHVPTLARTLYAEALRVLGDAAPAPGPSTPAAGEPATMPPRKPKTRCAA